MDLTLQKPNWRSERRLRFKMHKEMGVGERFKDFHNSRTQSNRMIVVRVGMVILLWDRLCQCMFPKRGKIFGFKQKQNRQACVSTSSESTFLPNMRRAAIWCICLVCVQRKKCVLDCMKEIKSLMHLRMLTRTGPSVTSDHSRGGILVMILTNLALNETNKRA